MPKSPSFFKNLFTFSNQHPLMVIGILYVLLMPALGSIVFMAYLIPNHLILASLPILDSAYAGLFVLAGALAMGLAWLPTTLFTAVTGFLFGWKALPLLLMAYLLANIIGYFLGKKLDNDFLVLIKKLYPKIAGQLNNKTENLGSLIFFIRLSPVIPFALSNFLFAILNTGLKKILVFGIMGMLPRTILSFLSGTLAATILDVINKKGFEWGNLSIIVLLIISIWGILRFFKPANKE
jgi:uncharacterized membrane protein YdjX (TVP38/TMEM64 family)